LCFVRRAKELQLSSGVRQTPQRCPIPTPASNLSPAIPTSCRGFLMDTLRRKTRSDTQTDTHPVFANNRNPPQKSGNNWRASSRDRLCFSLGGRSCSKLRSKHSLPHLNGPFLLCFPSHRIGRPLARRHAHKSWPQSPFRFVSASTSASKFGPTSVGRRLHPCTVL
jgi:hypothetical protein